MCGIAGIVAGTRLDGEERARTRLMANVLAHRGPDAEGFYADDQAALAHRRLSIVDLVTGDQPLHNEDGRLSITFNGEIYNHADLRAELEAAGHRYRTRSDTETIIHAYEEWGDECVHRLRGMFAFALWDASRRRLLLARDRLGIKPLYWTLARDRLVFASEMKAIFASGLVAPRARDELLPELLSTRYLSGADTLFAGISKLLPGHLLVFEREQVTVRKYWDLPVPPPHAQRQQVDDREVVGRFRELLEESVRLRLMSDVPLGMFLSGGLDSSAIAAIMARQIDRPLETFSVAFAERAFSELEFARSVAAHIGANAHEVVISAQDFFGALPRLLWHEDEPIAHPSSVPLYFVSALARDHVKVVLTGEGSDELLAGYGKYPRALLNWRAGAWYERLVPAVVRRAVANTLLPRLPDALARFATRSFLAMPHRADDIFFDNFAAIGRRQQARLLAPHASPNDCAYASSLACFHERNGSSTVLDRLLYTDIKTYLLELLMKQDQMSMAASIESRVPFLDHVLVEYASALPDRWKLRGFTTKRVLREAVRDLLPPEILARRKMGFPVPFGMWLRAGWAGVARDVLLDRRTRERGIIDPAAVEQLLADHEAGRANAADPVWALVNLELWYRTFIDGDGIQTLPGPARQARTDAAAASVSLTANTVTPRP